MTGGQRLGCRETPTTPFIQNRVQRFKPQPNGDIVDHQSDSSRLDSSRESHPAEKSAKHESVIYQQALSTGGGLSGGGINTAYNGLAADNAIQQIINANPMPGLGI